MLTEREETQESKGLTMYFDYIYFQCNNSDSLSRLQFQEVQSRVLVNNNCIKYLNVNRGSD